MFLQVFPRSNDNPKAQLSGRSARVAYPRGSVHRQGWFEGPGIGQLEVGRCCCRLLLLGVRPLVTSWGDDLVSLSSFRLTSCLRPTFCSMQPRRDEDTQQLAEFLPNGECNLHSSAGLASMDVKKIRELSQTLRLSSWDAEIQSSRRSRILISGISSPSSLPLPRCFWKDLDRLHCLCARRGKGK